ncbi:3830_t:CDS:2 [Funneliformis geosporum]|uniref:17040_t:CDS:1 n=1 Tax=Funneliformis geosporum TaxID=1117311 RepID=A0A9W4SYP9_9GLOM|nr:17040_t:CDS:2 [Funneliformis geosporum]CAI2186429.1 3830_t:CDS:2 [Funneliformis geosporum]
MSVYTMTSEEKRPSPSEELKDIPYSRVSETIIKATEGREGFIDETSLSPTSSKSLNCTEFNDSPLLSKSKNSEKNLNKNSARNLNEKYATMQQKMTQMAREISYPKTRSTRNSKITSRSNIGTIRQDDQLEIANPFLVDQSNMNSTVGNLMNRWSDVKLERKNLSRDSEQDLPSDEIGSTNILMRPQATLDEWKDDSLNYKSTEPFTSNMAQISLSSLKSTTPNYCSGQDSSSNLQSIPVKRTRWAKSAPRLNPSTCNESVFSTPVHSPSSLPCTMRKRARRIVQNWPLLSQKDNEDEFDALLEHLSSPSPSPSRILNKDLLKDDGIFNNSFDDDGFCQTSPKTSSDTNIYTWQLSQQHLGFDDAARNPIFTETALNELDDY